MDASLSPQQLRSRLCDATPPLVIDVRREPAFRAANDCIAGALRRDPEAIDSWAPELPRNRSVVVYCVHGHAVSQTAAAVLRARGLQAHFLGHGLEGWRESGGALQAKPQDSPTRWVTRERPKIDRIACPWLIARFVDRDAEFLYVPAAEVRAVAEARSAIPFDVEGAEFGHSGEHCSFDAFLARYGLRNDPALAKLATIVRGADTARLDIAPESAGVLAVSIGLSSLFADDAIMRQQAMVLYDALYRWCMEGNDPSGTWNLLPDSRRSRT